MTGIGESAFYNCTSLQSISIPGSVTEIERWAFCGCSGLTSITIPNQITRISEYTFGGCYGLKSVTIPPSVRSIGHESFSCCYGLEQITIPGTVETIEMWAFIDCISLTDVTMQEGVKRIELGAFAGCEQLKEIRVPDSVTEFGYWEQLDDGMERDSCTTCLDRPAADNWARKGIDYCLLNQLMQGVGDGRFLPGDAMAWAFGTGLIQGVAKEDGIYLSPKSNTTRAQVATILMRYHQAISG